MIYAFEHSRHFFSNSDLQAKAVREIIGEMLAMSDDLLEVFMRARYVAIG